MNQFFKNISVLTIWIFLIFFTGFSSESDNDSLTLILESANHNENTFVNGELISILSGNVIFSYDDISIRSDEATWWRNDGIIRFQNNIKVLRGSQILKCDKMHFTQKDNLLTASGNFHFKDTLEQTELSGKNAQYYVESRLFYLSGDPLLVRVDTAAAETLTISGIKMSYIDSIKCATVTDSVKITKGDLFSSCMFASYYTDSNYATLRTDPFVTYKSHKITGDSIDLTFGKESLKNASITGNSHGIYIDTSDSKNDTTFTHIWGDSLFFSVSDSGQLDSIWAFGKALCKHFISTYPDRINEASGKTMLLSFTQDSNVDNLKIWGNAKSTYHIEEDNNKGTNEVSGDSITVYFNKGKASQLTLDGSARGVYYPQNL